MLLRPMNLLTDLPDQMRELGPYAVVVLIVPGGCLLALAFWACRHPVMSALNRRLSCALVTAKVVLAGVGVIAVASTCLNGCASSGFYQMSDGWCMQHPAASPARCHGNSNDVVQVGRTHGSQHQKGRSRQQAGQEPSAPLPAFVLSENSAGESADESSTGRSGAR